MKVGYMMLQTSFRPGRVVTVGAFVVEVGRHVGMQLFQRSVLKVAQVTLVPTAGGGGGSGGRGWCGCLMLWMMLRWLHQSWGQTFDREATETQSREVSGHAARI